jgi:hypothetical protein
MRRMAPVLAVLAFIALPLIAQRPQANERPDDPPGLNRCCNTRVLDRNDQLIGNLIRWDDRFPTQPLQAMVSYKLKGGDEVALVVSTTTITGLQHPGGSVALFTTPDCSGNDLFVILHWPPLMKRYAMVLPAGAPGTVHFAPTNAWLFVTEAFPSRVDPGATVFHSQWGESGACVPYPPPGYTVMGSPFGGFWMKRVEDLLAKYKRPFYSKH